MGYEYIIEYKKGVDNQATDSLSRVIEFQLMSISTPRVDWWQQLQTEVANYPFFESLGKGTNPTNMFSYRDGVWFDRGKIYLSPASSLLQDVMKDFHSSPTQIWFNATDRVTSTLVYSWKGLD